VPRQVRDSNLENRTARARLKVAHKPYFRLIEHGLHLGYRRLPVGAGTWVVRRYVNGKYSVVNLRTPDGGVVLADDFAEADGRAIMTFAQAQNAARIKPGQRVGPYTVAAACDDYLDYLRSDGRSERAIADAKSKLSIVKSDIGNVKTAALTSERLMRCRNRLVERGSPSTEDERRAARATANRTWKTLAAALNHAFRNDKIDSDKPWRKVSAFKGVDTARVRHLTVKVARRLINACDPDFRNVVQAALQTGARYGELTRLTVADFNPDAGTVAIHRSKTSKPRHVILTDEGAALFQQLCEGRSRDEIILRHRDGRAWGDDHQIEPMQRACKHARIDPPIGIHGLRHTWASLAVMAGMPLMVVARNLGHRDTRMVERHYGHLTADFVNEAIRSHAPRFGIETSTNVRPLERSR
jgi:integrase